MNLNNNNIFKISLAIIILLAAIPASYAAINQIKNNINSQAAGQTCQTPTQAGSVEFCIKTTDAVFPTYGPTSGSNTILISGSGFPYAPTNAYVGADGSATTNGGHLVAQFDAINNVGLGDEYHSTTTSVWKNLADTTGASDGKLCKRGDNTNITITRLGTCITQGVWTNASDPQNRWSTTAWDANSLNFDGNDNDLNHRAVIVPNGSSFFFSQPDHTTIETIINPYSPKGLGGQYNIFGNGG
ncbi:MAG: hypothetical protein LBN03_02690, partial [Bifidobacteriaceae bacterium]|nr:hypothetical protein [Bifidobacteriaceae bacterium]